jgi:magnesium transporter
MSAASEHGVEEPRAGGAEDEVPSQDRLLERLHAHVKEGDIAPAAELVAALHAGEVAALLESMPREERGVVWRLVAPERQGEVLVELHEEVRARIVEEMDRAELVAAARGMDAEDLADVFHELPRDLTQAILMALDADRRSRLESSLSFPENTAGRLMNAEVVTVRPDVTVAVVLRYLRWHQSLPPYTDALMVTSEEGRYLGKLRLRDVVTADPAATAADVMDAGADRVRGETPEHDVAALFERRDLVSVAVLDGDDRLLGRIAVDDVLDIIREEADRAFLHRAGLDEEDDLFAPVLPSARRRAVWLGINLGTVFLAAWVIGRFEAALSQIVALAVLMPVVASMGGIAGSQTLTLTIRGQALGQIAAANVRWLARKELAVGLLNGLVWAVVVGAVTQLWFGRWGISLVIGAAMVLNLFVAALSGVLIPLVLKRLGLDPALSGVVALTTVTDVVGFMTFLGLATWLLL